MKKYIIATAVLIAIAAAAVIGATLAQSSTTMFVEKVNTTNVPANVVLARTVSSQGLTVQLYLTGSPRVGVPVTIYVLVRNENNGANPVPSSTTVTVTDQTGAKVEDFPFVPTQGGGIAVGQIWEMTAKWDTP